MYLLLCHIKENNPTLISPLEKRKLVMASENILQHRESTDVMLLFLEVSHYFLTSYLPFKSKTLLLLPDSYALKNSNVIDPGLKGHSKVATQNITV